jgi:hypothetical protein
MVDVLYIAVLIAFFALMVGFVRLCERVVGKDDAIDVDLADDGADADDDIDPDDGAPATDRTDPASTVKTPEEVTS